MDEFEKDPLEFSPLPDEGNSCAGEQLPVQNEYDRPDEYQNGSARRGQTSERQAKKKDRRSRFQSKLLLQAAAVMVAVVAITASFNVDPLRSDALFSGGTLSGGTLDDQLHQAGAQDGIITISMLWMTTDDMDLHVRTPSGDEIFFGNPRTERGELDIDMQITEPFVSSPVENIYFTDPERGKYEVWVYNFTDRTPGSTQVLVRVKIAGRKAQEYVVSVDSLADVCTFFY